MPQFDEKHSSKYPRRSLNSKYSFYVDFSLSTVMLSTRVAWGHSPGPVLPVMRPHSHFPDQSQCCDWTSPCGFYDCKMYLRNKQQGTLEEKKKVYYSQVPKDTGHTWSHTWGHTVRSQVERKREHRIGVLPLLGLMVEC